MLKLAFVFVVWSASVGILIMAERCRRNPHRCPDMFMARNGLTRSLVALWFIGRAEEARRAIVVDAKLRQLYLIERYIWGLMGFMIGIGALLLQ
jgi:hypothetical protein